MVSSLSNFDLLIFELDQFEPRRLSSLINLEFLNVELNQVCAYDWVPSLNKLGLMSVELDSILRLRTYSFVRMARAYAHARTYYSR